LKSKTQTVTQRTQRSTEEEKTYHRFPLIRKNQNKNPPAHTGWWVFEFHGRTEVWVQVASSLLGLRGSLWMGGQSLMFRRPIGEIGAVLPNAAKPHAITFARQICAIEKRPLTLSEIITRMKEAGYVTRSQSFAKYLRRLLRSSKNFMEISPGYWLLKIHAEKAG
jgi:hypothetical protein